MRPIPYKIYKHFKGNLYQVICIADDSETGEEMVVYQALYGDYKFYVRPLQMFVSKVDKIKYPNATQEYRFEVYETTNASKTIEVSQQSGSYVSTNAVANQGSSTTVSPKANVSEASAEATPGIDPDVLEFLDAENYDRRIEILGRMKYKINNNMIDIMSTVLDIQLPGNDVQRRYDDFVEALETKRHFECSRLRSY